MTSFSDDPHAPPVDSSRFSMFRFTRTHRALTLLAALFLQIILMPFDRFYPLIGLLLQLIVIFANIFMVADTRRHLTVGLLLGIPASIILIFAQMPNPLVWVAYVMILLLYLHVMRLMLLGIFKAQKVTLDTIGLAMCTYVLLGILWTLFYIPLVAYDPNAFTFNSMPDGISMTDNLTYYSFVTLTTLGFGDIVPVSALARSLTMLEALTGVLFLAVLISRLVGSYSSDRRRGES